MKKNLSHLVLFVFLLSICFGISSSQEVDLSGTWVGETEVPDQGTDEITLVLEKVDGEYTGTITDSLGMLDEEECKDVEFKEGKLTFNFAIFDGYDYMTVWITMTVEGNRMTGYWETGDGTSGSVELEKKIE